MGEEAAAPATTNLKPLADALIEARALVDDLEVKAKKAKVAEKQAESNLVQAMTEADLDSAKLDNGVRINIRRTLLASVKNVDMKDFKEWAQLEGLMPEIMREAVAKKLLNAEVKRRVEAGEDIPDSIGYYVKEAITLKT